MTYVNCGARTRDGQRVASKKALREALAKEPSEILFDLTSPLGPQIGERGVVCGDSIPEGYTLQVCGPDPYKSRKWWASVSVGKTGKITVT